MWGFILWKKKEETNTNLFLKKKILYNDFWREETYRSLIIIDEIFEFCAIFIYYYIVSTR